MSDRPTRYKYVRRLGSSLFVVPTLMFALPLYELVVNPGVFLEAAGFYLIWIIVPYAIGALLLVFAWKKSRKGGR